MWKTNQIQPRDIQRIWKSFLMKSRRLSFVHLIRIREVTSMDFNCGNSIITRPMMRCQVLQGRKTEPLRIFGIDWKTIRNVENHQKPLLGKKDRNRFNDKLDPKIREYLQWLSENLEQYFTKERELSTSSSSSQWSSTSWWSSHVWSSTWRGWQQQSWQDDKWSDQRKSMKT